MNGLLVAALSGASLALLGSAHCAVMCGPMAMASSARSGGGARYFTGRLVTYTLLGALAGSSGRVLTSFAQAKWIEAGLSWLFAVMLLVAALRYVRPRPVSAPLTIGKKPRVRLVSRVLAAAAQDPLLLGAATALLPCGLLFGVVVAATALGSPGAGAVAMATFASLSGLALLGLASVGRRLALGPTGRRALALGMLVGCAVMVWRPIPTLRSETNAPSCHGSEVQAP